MRSEKTGQIITSDPMRFIFLSTLQQENSDYEGRFVRHLTERVLHGSVSKLILMYLMKSCIPLSHY